MIKKGKQIWAVGEMVKVGFLKLQIISSKETKGDFKPDAYLLTNGKSYYVFVPHNGLTKLYCEFGGNPVCDIENAQIEFSKF